MENRPRFPRNPAVKPFIKRSGNSHMVMPSQRAIPDEGGSLPCLLPRPFSKHQLKKGKSRKFKRRLIK